MRSVQRLGVVVLGVVLLAGAGVAAQPYAARAAVGPQIWFTVNYGNCFNGHAPANEQIAVTWRRANGSLKAGFTVMSDESGFFGPPQAVCDANVIEAGDRIRATPSNPDLARNFKVRAITGLFNRKTDVVSGQAPANTNLVISVHRCGVGICLGATEQCPEHLVPVNGSGQYIYDTTGCDGSFYDAIGSDWASLRWTSPNGDTIYLEGYAPFLRVTVKGHQIAGRTAPGTSVTGTDKRPNGTVRGTAHATSDVHGWYTTHLRNSSGTLVSAQPGETLSGNWAGTVSSVVPAMPLNFGTDEDIISGHCGPNVNVWVTIRHDGTWLGQGESADSNGDWIADTTLNHDLDTSDVVEVWCPRPSGDQLRRQRTVP